MVALGPKVGKSGSPKERYWQIKILVIPTISKSCSIRRWARGCPAAVNYDGLACDVP